MESSRPFKGSPYVRAPVPNNTRNAVRAVATSLLRRSHPYLGLYACQMQASRHGLIAMNEHITTATHAYTAACSLARSMAYVAPVCGPASHRPCGSLTQRGYNETLPAPTPHTIQPRQLLGRVITLETKTSAVTYKGGAASVPGGAGHAPHTLAIGHQPLQAAGQASRAGANPAIRFATVSSS